MITITRQVTLSVSRAELEQKDAELLTLEEKMYMLISDMHKLKTLSKTVEEGKKSVKADIETEQSLGVDFSERFIVSDRFKRGVYVQVVESERTVSIKTTQPQVEAYLTSELAKVEGLSPKDIVRMVDTVNALLLKTYTQQTVNVGTV